MLEEIEKRYENMILELMEKKSRAEQSLKDIDNGYSPFSLTIKSGHSVSNDVFQAVKTKLEEVSNVILKQDAKKTLSEVDRELDKIPSDYSALLNEVLNNLQNEEEKIRLTVLMHPSIEKLKLFLIDAKIKHHVELREKALKQALKRKKGHYRRFCKKVNYTK